ncbi:Major facilitator superfamily domain general substrate transporter [Penicillium macrosclerotiorum]|uniref:Major facilitator superfamily domain general substrate transporter n=1 Tax=Penicillium macrosclerotiorum TaxID=303699 RepID=UPI0025482ACB|nr:Major facilitator superfamily domain general substrate transporter [Penicillium macrosclerotiorum]KAJ5676180.1 Major facilitator superfamily domain general substrate transporter [Penicillium macrosclerotiorum]
MFLIYKQIKKRNERKIAEQAIEPPSENIADDLFEEPDTEKESNKKKIQTPEEAAENRKRRVYRWKLILGLFSPFCLQALDTTIVASALPYIATDFNQIKQLNWIISSFNLCSAAFLFFWAQLTDLFGRHVTLQAAIFIMMVGSAICTGAPTSAFSVLLLGRALQGVGAAGVNISIRTILADRVSLSEYALNWTIFALVSGVSFSIGPVIGGYLTQASWRWCFAINLPIAFIAMIVVFFILRKELQGPQDILQSEERTNSRIGRFVARISTLDFGGQMLFLWGFGLLILALTWGGGNYSWSSAAVLAPIVVGGILSIGWVFYERCMAPGAVLSRIFPRQKAMMPWELLSQRDVGLLFLINFSIGIAMFAVMYFMDLYFALVEGKSSGSAGLALLYFLPGLGAGAYMAMFSSNVWPRQTFPALLLGSLTAAIGITVLAWAVHASKTSLIYGMMALVGHGVGIRLNPASLHGLAYFPAMTAQISCLVSFAVPFGGLVGLTIMSTVFTNKSGAHEGNPRSGIMWAFIAMIPFMWVSVLLTTFLGNVWILKGGSHEVVNRAYLWSIVTGRGLEKERRDRLDAGN